MRERKARRILMDEKDIIANITNHYTIRVLKAFGNDQESVKAMEQIAKSLIDIYRYFEPAYYDGELNVCKSFNDEFVLPKNEGERLYDKSILLKKNTGDFILQVFSDGQIWIWDDADVSPVLESCNTLIYRFRKNKEYYLANGEEVEITRYSKGSQYKNEFMKLNEELFIYSNDRIRHSSCPTFDESWFDDKRIFFKGGGKDVPEKYMQESLAEFLKVRFRGIDMEVVREHNTGASNPVDIKVHWREANRVALIEIKWLGKSKKPDGTISSINTNVRANEGAYQLKGYHDATRRDLPNTILRSYLVVIDGRRWWTSENTKSISKSKGLKYENEDLDLDDDRKYYKKHIDIEKPIRMFAEPICDN